jgi:hypothetical protein
MTVTNTSQAAFTEDDIRQFLATHQRFMTTDGSTPQIARVLFIPASQASTLLKGEPIGRPAPTLVFYVEVHGNLSTASIHSPPGVNIPSIAHVGDIVFDAQTGHLLLWGFDG